MRRQARVAGGIGEGVSRQERSQRGGHPAQERAAEEPGSGRGALPARQGLAARDRRSCRRRRRSCARRASSSIRRRGRSGARPCARRAWRLQEGDRRVREGRSSRRRRRKAELQTTLGQARMATGNAEAPTAISPPRWRAARLSAGDDRRSPAEGGGRRPARARPRSSKPRSPKTRSSPTAGSSRAISRTRSRNATRRLPPIARRSRRSRTTSRRVTWWWRC